MNFSDNRIFAIENNGAPILYVISSVKLNHPFIIEMRGRKNIEGYDYKKYKYDGTGVKDCLQFSESFACKMKDYKESKPLYREKDTQLLLGHTHKQNLKIIYRLRSWGMGDDEHSERIVPDVGEAYAIINESESKKHPYHVAPVIAKDGDTRITIEVSAETNDAIQDGKIVVREKPLFYMYSVTNPNESFHRHLNTEEYKNPVSVVLLPRK